MPTENEISGTPKRRPKQSPTSIGNHKLKPSTLMLGYGFDPALSEGSLKPPVFLTSTFVFDSAADGKRFFEGVTGKRPGGAEGLIYSRFNGPNQEILEDRLAVWEGADDALAFSSGMSAIATLLLTFVQPGDVVVHSGPLYAATETLIAKILGRFGVSYLDFPSGASREEIDAVIAKAKAKGRVALIYLESPANPTNQLVDVEAVTAARNAAFPEAERPPIAIDNTFLGPLWAHPLKQGADISVYSLTKYAGGHSDLVAGGLVGRQGLIDQIRMMRNTIGTICDPNTAWMLLRSLETLELRMEQRGRERCEGLRFPSRPSEGRKRRLSRLPRGRLAAGRHLQSPLHGRGLDLLALPQGRRERGFRFPRFAQDRAPRGQPRRNRDARQRSGGDDALVGAGRAQAGARHHRQSRADLDRCRRPGRSHRRLR